jgi:hypothetical protein
VPLVVEERGHLRQPGGEFLRVLQAAPLSTQLFFFADAQAGGVELGHLEAQQILPLDAIALGTARPVELVARRAKLGEEPCHAFGKVIDVREAVEQFELPQRFEQPLMLMLPVHVDQVLAKTLEQRYRHRRVVDERAVPTRARELPPDDHLTFSRLQPRVP